MLCYFCVRPSVIPRSFFPKTLQITPNCQYRKRQHQKKLWYRLLQFETQFTVCLQVLLFFKSWKVFAKFSFPVIWIISTFSASTCFPDSSSVRSYLKKCKSSYLLLEGEREREKKREKMNVNHFVLVVEHTGPARNSVIIKQIVKSLILVRFNTSWTYVNFFNLLSLAVLLVQDEPNLTKINDYRIGFKNYTICGGPSCSLMQWSAFSTPKTKSIV
jgi:hypothetical protein